MNPKLSLSRFAIPLALIGSIAMTGCADTPSSPTPEPTRR